MILLLFFNLISELPVMGKNNGMHISPEVCVCAEGLVTDMLAFSMIV